MGKYWHCLSAGHSLIGTVLALCLFLAGISPRAYGSGPNQCASQLLDKTFQEEVRRQWDYLDKKKTEKDKALKRNSARLLRAIENHAAANNLVLERDPQNSSALLIRVLSKEELKTAHPLARFAASLFEKYEGLRVEIDPLKLKKDDAGALFDEDTNRLTLAIDNVLELHSDSFVGHELRHAYSTHLERAGIEHVFMGWMKRNQGTPPMHETYPDAFSLDEHSAYYYQVLDLLHEAVRDPGSLKTAKDFIHHSLKLLSHSTSDEIAQFALTYLKQNQNIKITKDQKHQILSVETPHYTLELDFLLVEPLRTDEELRERAIKRLNSLNARTKTMKQQLEKAEEMLNANADIKAVIQILASKRDVIDPKVDFVQDSSMGNGAKKN